MTAFALPERSRQAGGAAGSILSPALLPWLWLGLLAFAAQILVVEAVGRADPGSNALPALLLGAHLLLVPFLVRNFRYWGVRLILLGLLLNLAAQAANGGLMPVTAHGIDAVGRQHSSELQTGEHIGGTKNAYMESADIRLPWLVDAIVLPLPQPFTRVVSVGDIIIGAGTLGALATITRRSLLRDRNDA